MSDEITPSDGEPYTFDAHADYHPGEDVPLVVTVDAPEWAIETAGGWEGFTESVRVQHTDVEAMGDVTERGE